ncbi:hypothetical protein CMEL01_09736 [Colletotrichum melonis]|uniref:Secreted protein n=1 Tax=Colletotrichum melonis TaxID=1209925 RepID=A0AAI9XFA5_9PEZI|nr:hypothetical protein CMEL01_09736 [Colletotrichum melonis]
MDVDCLYFFSLLLWLLLVGPSRWTACVKLCRPSTGATSTSVQQASLFLLVSQSATPETPKAKINQCVSQFSGFPVCGLPMSDGTHLSMGPIVSFRAASSSGDAERNW